MPEPSSNLCDVESAEGVVLIECGNAAATLDPDTATDLTERIIASVADIRRDNPLDPAERK